MSAMSNCLRVLLLLPLVGVVHGAEVNPLFNMPLPAIGEGQEVQMVTVSYAPGEASETHRHDAHTFVYVLEGTVEMAVAGGETVTLGPGGTFYESPDDIHEVSRNASTTEPAKFLVYFIRPAQ